MNSRVSRVGLALLASLTVAAACFAAEPDSTTARKTTVDNKIVAASGPGKGGIGVQVGGSTFSLDRALGKDWFIDYSDGGSPRLSFAAHWRYQMTKRWRGQLATGFAWTGYSGQHDVAGVPKFPPPFQDPNFPTDKDKKDYLTLMLPVSLQLQYVGRHGLWAYHVGAGPGAYRVWVENRRKVLKDPATLKLHRGLYPGYSTEIGIEHWLKGIPEVSLEFTIANHVAMTQRPDQFKSGFNSNVMATEFRVGGNYYFTPGPRKAPAATPKSP
jgi:hypothetical protein